MGLNSEQDGLGGEQCDYNRSPPAGDFLEAFNPDVAVPADGVEHAPETVVHVQPKGTEADKVHHKCPPLRESDLEIESAEVGSGRHTFNHGESGKFVCGEFGKLHLCPELDKMDGEKCQHHDAEDEHVLGRPFHLGRTAAHRIAVGATCTAVLDSEPQGIDYMHDEQERQTGRSHQSVPVGTQELANDVVRRRPEQGNRIHQAVKRNE